MRHASISPSSSPVRTAPPEKAETDAVLAWWCESDYVPLAAYLAARRETGRALPLRLGFLDEVLSGPCGESPPAYVERSFRSYLECGILVHGFARAWPCGSGCWRCPNACATSCKRMPTCRGRCCASF
jgi:hypothetical protein